MEKEAEQLESAGAVVDLVRNNKKLGTIPKVPVTKKGEVVMTSPFYI